MKNLKKAYQIFCQIETYLLSAAFLFMVGFICCDVVLRKFTGNGFPWLEEFSRAVFVIATMIGASVAVTTDEHPRMTVVLMKLSPRSSSLLYLLTNILSAVFFAFIFFLSCQQVNNLMRFGTCLTSIPLKLWHIYIFFPISLAGMVLRFLFAALLAAEDLQNGETSEKGAAT